jgi:high-affinity iron transporter
MSTRSLPRIVARAVVLVLVASLTLFASAEELATESATSPEQLLFLLQYVAVDYEAAVRDGEIADPHEFREMVEFSERLVDAFEVLRLHGASEHVRDGLAELRTRIAERRPVDEVRSLANALAARLFDELDSIALPAGAPSAERGAGLFVPNCAPCHGMTGGGDGWAAGWLDPKATSFRETRMNLLSPHQVYSGVAFGIEGTAMPSYSGALTSREMWDIAFHVMTLRHDFAPAVDDPGLPLTLADVAHLSSDDLLARARGVRPDANRTDIDFSRRSPPGAEPGPAGDSGLELAIRLQDAFAAGAERVFPSVGGLPFL